MLLPLKRPPSPANKNKPVNTKPRENPELFFIIIQTGQILQFEVMAAVIEEFQARTAVIYRKSRDCPRAQPETAHLVNRQV